MERELCAVIGIQHKFHYRKKRMIVQAHTFDQKKPSKNKKLNNHRESRALSISKKTEKSSCKRKKKIEKSVCLPQTQIRS